MKLIQLNLAAERHKRFFDCTQLFLPALSATGRITFCVCNKHDAEPRLSSYRRLVCREAVDLCDIQGLLDDGKPFPEPSTIEQLQKKRSYRGWTWAVVDVDPSELGDRAARNNLTLPQRIRREVDARARKQGETRSGFLARAALVAMRKLA